MMNSAFHVGWSVKVEVWWLQTWGHLDERMRVTSSDGSFTGRPLIFPNVPQKLRLFGKQRIRSFGRCRGLWFGSGSDQPTWPTRTNHWSNYTA
jgi:hypothetical protein